VQQDVPEWPSQAHSGLHELVPPPSTIAWLRDPRTSSEEKEVPPAARELGRQLRALNACIPTSMIFGTRIAPIGPQGKLIEGMSASVKEELRKRLRERLPIASNGRVVYESFANAVRGWVRG
jgi:hypothetical protein